MNHLVKKQNIIISFKKIQGLSIYPRLPRNSLCRPGWPQSYRDPLAFAS